MFAHTWYQQFHLSQPPTDEIRPLLGLDKTTWTRVMTCWVVRTCEQMGWAAVARSHRTPILPIPKSELLSIDVMVFPAGASRWAYPIAAIELENQQYGRLQTTFPTTCENCSASAPVCAWSTATAP